MKRLGLIGLGAMSRFLPAALSDRLRTPFETLSVLITPTGVSTVETERGGWKRVGSCGADPLLASAGALADDELHERLPSSARACGARLMISAGAVAGLDALAAAGLADPGVEKNMHELAVESNAANFTVVIEGIPSPEIPQTSRTAGYSLAHKILSHASAFSIKAAKRFGWPQLVRCEAVLCPM